MIVPRLAFLACSAAFFLVAATAPPAGAPAKPSPAQIARIKALTEKVGVCHHQQAAAKAATEAEIDMIVGETLSVCEPQAEALETQLSKYIGASAAKQSVSARRPAWREAIRRIVAAERARSAAH